MNDDIVPLPNGDFTVVTKQMRDMERKIREAMMIPTPVIMIPKDQALELDVMVDDGCPLCAAGIPVTTQAERTAKYLRKLIDKAELKELEKHLPGVQESDFKDIRVPVSAMPDDDLRWSIVKLNEGKEYFLKKMNEDGTREWTRDNTICRTWASEHEADDFASIYFFEQGTYGVRGLLVK
jgi:hypothetical protein